MQAQANTQSVSSIQTQSIIPCISTTKMRETRAFWIDRLGFELSYDHEHYLGVRGGAKGAPEIGFMPSSPEAPQPIAGGLNLCLRVASADAEHERLRSQGVAIFAPLTDYPWGMRAFVVKDPNGVAVTITHPIPAAVEFEACAR
ncbi:MAG: VOC family protein [Planctomycetes bacterium]|nr:VOC family protein [Planctomycetota bacterium]